MNIIIQDTDTQTHIGLAAYLRQRGVEHAISNNHGLVTGNTYRGFSSDGTVEIWFYYNSSNGSIISFFPKVN